jgi:1-acyl-sn-glycerol-3-phosphate acyltransferase
MVKEVSVVTGSKHSRRNPYRRRGRDFSPQAGAGTTPGAGCDDVAVADNSIPVTYRVVMAVAAPIVRWWGRLEVVGQSALPASGPAVLIANHDSAWDPLVLGVAAVRRRQLRALAKSSLWKVRPVAWVLDHMGQIPIERGRGDVEALSAAIDALRAGACIGVFPEGTVSRGRALRPLSGAGRVALAVPEATVVCVAVSGSVDVVRFPKRPRIRVEFFEPSGGPPREGESAISLAKRTTADVRARAPHAIPGRRKKAAEYRRLADEADSEARRP